ncbi:hypothetical protein MNBD_GAMMA05-1382 [hydrothermal vent metagenome]|uniref:Uncharacterized protein n=1 Tax=hydrothermal vent metagenome TaxID=652676 RepID=A0A3B0W4Z6_9ZZZZ
MQKRRHKILSWFLTILLMWLPLSVSADISIPAQERDNCHEVSFDAAKVSASDHSVERVAHKQVCCDQCGDQCNACSGLSSCGHSLSHVSPFIIIHQHTSQSLQLVRNSIEQYFQYQNWIILPDFRPPVV